MATHLTESRTVPVEAADAFGRTMPMPLETIFTRRVGPFPPVKDVDGPPTWDAVGQSRTIRLSDGGTMLETLTTVEPPLSFGYQITDATGPMKPLIESFDGLWSFEPVGTGCRITWSWTVHPRGRLGAVAMPVFDRFWHGYARRALAQLETNLVGS